MVKPAEETNEPTCKEGVLRYQSFKLRKCSLVADKRLRSGLKAQQAHSPGYVLVAPSGRALNACAYSLIQLAKLE